MSEISRVLLGGSSDNYVSNKNDATSSFEQHGEAEKMMLHHLLFGKVIFPKAPKSPTNFPKTRSCGIHPPLVS